MSKQSIVLTATHPNGEEALIRGFRYIWAFYVKGYNPVELVPATPMAA